MSRNAGLAHVRAVVFDLDGTLVDSLDDIAGHLNSALADAGLATRTRDEIRGWIGTGAAQLVAGAVVDAARAADVLARFRTHYRAAPYARTRVYPGLAEVLDLLAARCTLGVLSNKPHEIVGVITRELLARWQFAVITGERAGHPRKPDPGALLAVVGELGIPAAECILVGDSPVDVATARAAGVTGVAVTWGLTDAEVLAAANPDYMVATPDELAALFALG